MQTTPEKPTSDENAEAKADSPAMSCYGYVVIFLIMFGGGWITAKLSAPKVEPATVRYVAQSGIELMTTTVAGGNSISIVGLESVMLTTNKINGVAISIRFAP